jgi:nucleoside-diphosphate-sugar epimerase
VHRCGCASAWSSATTRCVRTAGVSASGRSWRGSRLAERRVGVLGARSMVGEYLLPALTAAGWRVDAFSREAGVEWRPLGELGSGPSALQVPWWISIAPITIVPEYFDALRARGARRVVAVSSTSRFTRASSADEQEQALARRLGEAEWRVKAWAESHGVEWVILRPTLIYGRGRDRNIAEIAHFIRRYGFFPLLGGASGLRQPVHAEDVAAACFAALEAVAATNRAYNISGAERLTYREMVRRVFAALDRVPRMLSVPLWAFRLAIACLRLLPRHRGWTAAMAERMNQDLVFDHAEAARDLGFRPRPFRLSAADVVA